MAPHIYRVPSTGTSQAPEDSPLTMANMATWHSLAQLGTAWRHVEVWDALLAKALAKSIGAACLLVKAGWLEATGCNHMYIIVHY